MNKEEVLRVWAPYESPWSRWVKPVLFAHLHQGDSEPDFKQWTGDLNWSRSLLPNVTIVLDLPGDEAVRLGVALATEGYRPVPLYNAVPLPSFAHTPTPPSNMAAVEVLPIVVALRDGARFINAADLPSYAPPAFLLDANRAGNRQTVQPDEFDNRSLCFTTDFPSANFLAAHGIRRALLIQRTAIFPQADLAHVLCRWQDGGIALERLSLEPLQGPEPFEVSRPSWYGLFFQRALSAVGFRRSKAGGFGAWMNDSPGGG